MASTSGDVTDFLSQCMDVTDHVTLEDFAAFPADELVLLEMPRPWKEGQRYRCFARSSLLDYVANSGNHMSVEETGFVRLVSSTYLPGLDLEHRDLEFLARSLQQPPVDGGPTVLHVARIVEVPANHVHGSHGAAAHIHELAEAQWERQLWSLFDRAVMPGTTTCPSGHQLRQQKHPGHSALISLVVICDNCERTLVGTGRYRCTRNCDFDLCQDCYGQSLEGPRHDEADEARASGGAGARAAWLEQQLADFWREHEGFRLPSSPPRLDARSRRLSPAITKWNSFTLGDQGALLRLRELFSADLGFHGLDVSSLRPDFWPGCATQCERAERYVRRGRLAGRLTSQVMRQHARSLTTQLGPAWSEDLAEELLASVLSEKRPGAALAGRASASSAAWRYWASLFPTAAAAADRLWAPLLHVIFRAPRWQHLFWAATGAAGALVIHLLSPA